MSMQQIVDRADEALKRVCTLAMSDAARLYHPMVGSEHFLSAIAGDAANDAWNALQSMGVTRADVLAQLLMLQIPCRILPLPLPLAPLAEKVFVGMVSEANDAKSLHLGTEHLLLAMTREPECAAMKMLAAVGFPTARVRTRMKERMKLA